MIVDPMEGKFIRMRTAEEEDAEFTLAIRQNNKNTKYIPKLNIGLKQQIKWLDEQRQSDNCYFFVVERLSGEKIGTYSLYDILGDKAEAGRLVLIGNQIECVESHVLFNDFAYGMAGMSVTYFEIDKNNFTAIGGAKKYGAKEIERFLHKESGREMIKMQVTKEDYLAKREKLEQLIVRFADRKWY